MYRGNLTYERCNLCPRNCNVNRAKGEIAFCNSDSRCFVAHTMLHKWEEPCISSINGSGAIFFASCNLGCVYCQNYKISKRKMGIEVDYKKLSDIFFDLKKLGADNINLITMTHFTKTVIEAIDYAKEKGFDLPFISNTSGYENKQTIKELKGRIDIFLTDFKYMNNEIAKKYSNCSDYSFYAKEALAEMLNIVGAPVWQNNGLLKSGIIVRHLCLPSHTHDSIEILKYLTDTYDDKIIISIMNQYTPINDILKNYEEINRVLTKREYKKVVDFAIDIGIGEKQIAYIQGSETCKKSFIPNFL